MQKTIKSIRAILLAVVLAVGVFAATATPVYALAPTLSNYTFSYNETGIIFTFDLDQAADVFVAVYEGTPGTMSAADVQAGIGAFRSSSMLGLSAGSGYNDDHSLNPNTQYTIYIAAINADGDDVVSFTFKSWPTITSAASFSCVAGTGGSFDLTALGTGTINWTLSGAPAGVSLGSPLLIVAPTVPAGVYNFTITATSTLGSTSQNFTLTVTSVGTSGGGGGGGGAAATTGVSPKTDDATGGNMFLIVMMLLLAAGAVYTGRKVAKANK